MYNVILNVCMQNFKKSGIINILQLKLYWNVLKLEFLYIGIKENFRYIIKNKMENKSYDVE